MKKNKKALKNGFSDDNFGGKYWELFGLRLFGSDKVDLLKILAYKLSKKEKKLWIATVNPEFVMEATKDKNFREILGKTSVNVMDGIGLVWAKETKNLFSGLKVGVEILKGKHRDQVIAGSDLINDLCKLAQEKKYKVFFLGGFGEAAEKTKNYFKNRYSGLEAESSEGRPKVGNKEVIERINKFKPDILFVAYGMKKQEEWIDENLKDLDVGIVMGVGRSFDYYSGELKRAPMAWRKMGLEWLYSLIKEPKRWKRQLALPRFVWKVLKGE